MPNVTSTSEMLKISPELEQLERPGIEIYNEMLPATKNSAYDVDEKIGEGRSGSINIHAGREYESDLIDYTVTKREAVNVMAKWSEDNQIRISGSNHGATSDYQDPNSFVDPPHSYRVTIKNGADRADFEISASNRANMNEVMKKAFEVLMVSGVDAATKVFTEGKPDLLVVRR